MIYIFVDVGISRNNNPLKKIKKIISHKARCHIIYQKKKSKMRY